MSKETQRSITPQTIERCVQIFDQYANQVPYEPYSLQVRFRSDADVIQVDRKIEGGSTLTQVEFVPFNHSGGTTSSQ